MSVHRVLIAVIVVATLFLGYGIAKADPGLDQYTIVNAPIICTLLAQTPTVAGVEAVIGDPQQKGLSAGQAGEVLARSAVGWCPDQLPEVRAFANLVPPGKEAV